MNKPHTLLLIIAFLFLFFGSVYGNDYKDGFDAYQSQDYEEAVRLLEPIADQGESWAQAIVGMMYDNGQGVTQDHVEASKWFRLSAEQGNGLAQYNLGGMYDKGQGVPQDHKESLKWYHLSAKQGNSSAQLNLGVMYANGQGVLQDYVLAHMWFNLSGSDGNKRGINNRSILENKMTPSQIEKAQEMAREWMRRYRARIKKHNKNSAEERKIIINKEGALNISKESSIVINEGSELDLNKNIDGGFGYSFNMLYQDINNIKPEYGIKVVDDGKGKVEVRNLKPAIAVRKQNYDQEKFKDLLIKASVRLYFSIKTGKLIRISGSRVFIDTSFISDFSDSPLEQKIYKIYDKRITSCSETFLDLTKKIKSRYPEILEYTPQRVMIAKSGELYKGFAFKTETTEMSRKYGASKPLGRFIEMICSITPNGHHKLFSIDFWATDHTDPIKFNLSK
jgi:uncharacterized protein